MENSNLYEEFIVLSNKASIHLMKNSDLISASEHLENSLNMLKTKTLLNAQKLFSITYNNYGCYYKKQGMLEKALNCFNLALKYGKGTDFSLSETFLNVIKRFSGTLKTLVLFSVNYMKEMK